MDNVTSRVKSLAFAAVGLLAASLVIGGSSVEASSAKNRSAAGEQITYVEKVDALVRDGSTLMRAATDRAEAGHAFREAADGVLHSNANPSMASVLPFQEIHASAADFHEQAAEQYKGAFKLTGSAKTKFDAADHLWTNPKDEDIDFASRITQAKERGLLYKQKAIESYMVAAKERDRAADATSSFRDKALQKSFAAKNRESAVSLSDEATN